MTETTAEGASVEIVADASSSVGAFEGPEKLLEIWFAPTAEHVARRNFAAKGGRGSENANWIGLRQVQRKVWDAMLDEVQCKVLSVIEGEEVDAYLLSESSMFVWPHKLILKTCGTTTLLLGLPTLLRVAAETCGLHSVWRCFYSRKTFMFPDRQQGPHKDWTQEMGFLDKLFANSSAYTVGKMNGDHWLLYLTPPQDDVLLPRARTGSVSAPPQLSSSLLDTLAASLSPSLPRAISLPKLSLVSPPDQTLEILMSRLHPSACAAFYHPSSSSSTPYTSPLLASDPSHGDAHNLGGQLSDRLGLSALLPRATIDSFLFSPCGFSSNAVQGDRYATIHVTPEPDYSYASFETNLDFTTPSAVEEGPKSMPELVEKVLAIFLPAKLSITLFVSMDDEEVAEEEEMGRAGAVGKKDGNSRGKAHAGMKELLNADLLEKYSLVDRIIYEFVGYSLVYAVYEQLP